MKIHERKNNQRQRLTMQLNRVLKKEWSLSLLNYNAIGEH
jgi:hypothetical protein